MIRSDGYPAKPIAAAARSSAEIFLTFHYPEIKDLLKHFLTLISASLVFSVAFSEKIIGIEKAKGLQIVLMLGGWLFLLAALGLCGVGIYTLYLAAERAVLSLATGEQDDLRDSAWFSYGFQDLSALAFGIGLFLLVAAGAVRFI